MPDQNVGNSDRRAFFKWSFLGIATLAASVLDHKSSIFTKQAESAVIDLSDAATVITDASRGNHHRLIATQNFLLANPIGASMDGQRIVWEIIQDAGGGRAISLGSKFVLGADLKKVTLTTEPHKRDFLTAIYNQPLDRWHVVAFIKGY